MDLARNHRRRHPRLWPHRHGDTHFEWLAIPASTHDGGVHWRPEAPGLPRGVPSPNSKTDVYPYAEFQQPLFFGRFGIVPTTVRVCRRAHSPTGYVCTHGLYALLSRDGGRTWPLTRRFPFAPASPYHLAWQVMTATTWRALLGTRLWTTHDAGGHWA